LSLGTLAASHNVRSATRADAHDWLRLRQALWPDDAREEHAGDEHAREGHAREIERYFAGQLHEPVEVLLARDAAGTAIGLAELSIRSHAEGCVTDRVAYLEGWYVVPEARRQGVGRALVAAADVWARRLGCTEFASDAVIDNHVSDRVHRALGFVETAQIRTYRKLLVPHADSSPQEDEHG
jgi:aminoglycoside 6'-N-acetyltransferase I